MTLHRFILRPESAWGTPFRSDTLMGLLLYRIAEDEGPEACRAAIEAFLAGEAPFRLSSAMPAGALFAPKLPPPRRARFRELVERGDLPVRDGLFEALTLYKKFRKQPFLPLSVWEKHRAALSAEKLFKDFCRNPSLWEIKRPRESREMHVSIARNTNTAREGGLFATRAFRSEGVFHLYAETDDAALLLDRLQRLGRFGFGRDSSTGKGIFSIEEDRCFAPAGDSLPHGLLLSVFAAEDMAGLRGWYATEVKIAKAGPAFCKGNPFKSPFLFVREGAVLEALPAGPHVLRGLHANPDIVQITPPLCLPCALEAEQEEDHA